jgi:hypothetical protein
MTAEESAREELKAHGIERADKPLTTLYRIVKERIMSKKIPAMQQSELHAALPDLQTWLDRIAALPWAQIWMILQLILSAKQQAPKQATNQAGQPVGCESAEEIARCHLECIQACAECGIHCLDNCETV